MEGNENRDCDLVESDKHRDCHGDYNGYSRSGHLLNNFLKELQIGW